MYSARWKDKISEVGILGDMEVTEQSQVSVAPESSGPNLTFDRNAFLQTLKDVGARFAYLADNDLVNLAEGTIKAVNFAVSQKLDVIFFLDKSARPPAYLF